MQNFSIYILFHGHEEQLVLHTDEGKYLPLYIINEDRYLRGTITSWQNDYAAAYSLWLSSYKH
ncbi:hypothetical protein [Rickettsia argasii]|nr:hypothetical protein [Rickettsia argasii]